MNIFILDLDPMEASKYHCDKHVSKMLVESIQLLTSAYYYSIGITNKFEYESNIESVYDLFSNFPRIDENNNPKPYLITHQNHPCSIWTRSSIDNFKWLLDLALGLSNEYTLRYESIHACLSMIPWFYDNLPVLPNLGLTDFALAMPPEFRLSDPVKSYRNYYNSKSEYMKLEYKFTSYPSWMTRNSTDPK